MFSNAGFVLQQPSEHVERCLKQTILSIIIRSRTKIKGVHLKRVYTNVFARINIKAKQF